AAQAESFLINSVLTLVTHNQSMVLEDIRRQVVLPRTVRRAQDYMRHNVHEPPLLADLCQAIGVSARSLQTAFQSIFGLSPMSYWR
ncbi:AraC family transcriptional regulator, partial [Mesorhizobium japonicum]